MQSVSAYTVLTKFKLDLKAVSCPNGNGAGPPVDESYFLLSQPQSHRSIVSLVKPISGPQDVVLQLTMDMYHLGRFQASAVANIHVFVTPYNF